MLPNWFTLGLLLTCHLLMARLDHTAVIHEKCILCVQIASRYLAGQQELLQTCHQ